MDSFIEKSSRVFAQLLLRTHHVQFKRLRRQAWRQGYCVWRCLHSDCDYFCHPSNMVASSQKTRTGTQWLGSDCRFSLFPGFWSQQMRSLCWRPVVYMLLLFSSHDWEFVLSTARLTTLKGWANPISVVVTSGMGQYLKDLKNPEEQLETLIKVGSLRGRITAAIMVRFADRDLQSLFALHCLWAISNALVKISICHLYVSYGGLRWDGELRSISRCKYSDFVRFASLPTRSWWLAWLTASPLFSRLFYSAYPSGTIGTKVLTGAVEIRMQHTFPLPLSTS